MQNKLLTVYEQAIDQLSSEAIYSRFDHKFKQGDRKGKLRGYPPFRESKSGTSFTVYPDKGFYDSAEGFAGFPADYVHSMKIGRWERAKGKDFRDAVSELCDQAGLSMPRQSLSPQELEEAQKQDLRKQGLSAVFEYARQCLWSEKGTQALNYLVEERGFSKEGVEFIGLGYIDSKKNVAEYLSQQGFPSNIMQLIGFPDKISNLKWDGYITYPWFDDRGKPLTMYGRYQAKEHPQGLPKTLALSGEGTKRSPLYLDRAIADGQKHLVYVEGINDAALLQSKGETNVIASVSAGFSDSQVETLKRRNIEEVTIVNDGDQGGLKGTFRNIKVLAEAGIDSFCPDRLPNGQDPDDYVRDHGLSGWADHLDTAIHGFRWLARQIAEGNNLETDKGIKRAVDQAKEWESALNPELNSDAIERYFREELKSLGVVLRHEVALESSQESKSESLLAEFSEGFDELRASLSECLEIEDLYKQQYVLEKIAKHYKVSSEFCYSLLRDIEAEASQEEWRWIEDELGEEPEPRDWICPKHLARQSVQVVVGDGGVGKTFLTNDLVKSLAMGGEFLGISCKQSRSLILQLDTPRREAISYFQEGEFDQVPEKMVAVQYDWNMNQMDRLEKWIEQGEFDNVVIDSLAAANNNNQLDENHPLYAQGITRLTKLASKHNCSIIILHHANKLGDLRGSTAIRDNATELIHLAKDSESPDQRKLYRSKSRTGFMANMKIRLNTENFKWELCDSGQHEVNPEILEQALNHLANSQGYFTTKQIQNEINATAESPYNFAMNLKQEARLGRCRYWFERKTSQDGSSYKQYYFSGLRKPTETKPQGDTTPDEARVTTSTPQWEVAF